MQAIETKYFGPTNTKGSRIKASAQAGSVTVGWEYGAGNDTGNGEVDSNHDRAAVALIRKLGWFGLWARGASVKGEGNCYVCLKRQPTGANGQGTEIRTPAPLSVDPRCYLVVSE